MNKIPIEPGRAVLSKAGRDAGRRFVVLRTDEPFAYVADGGLRKAEAPKKKKHRHLKALPECFSSIAEILKDGGLPSNADIRRCLADRPIAPDQAEGLRTDPKDNAVRNPATPPGRKEDLGFGQE